MNFEDYLTAKDAKKLADRRLLDKVGPHLRKLLGVIKDKAAEGEYNLTIPVENNRLKEQLMGVLKIAGYTVEHNTNVNEITVSWDRA